MSKRNRGFLFTVNEFMLDVSHLTGGIDNEPSRDTFYNGRKDDGPIDHGPWSDQECDSMVAFVIAIRNVMDSPVGVTYMCFSPEKAPTTGMRHLQGYVRFKERKSANQVHGMFHDAFKLWTVSVHVAQDDHFQRCVDYCKGNCEKKAYVVHPMFFEIGAGPTGQGKRSELLGVIDDVASGASYVDIARNHSECFIKFSKGICNYIQVIRNTPRSHKTIVYWCYGPTGVGKSKWSAESAASLGSAPYYKNPETRWWCAMASEESVILDDYRANQEMKFQYLLRLFDRYPMQVEFKGGAMQFNARRIFVTTTRPIRESFNPEFYKEEDVSQLVRRCVQIEFRQEEMPAYPTIDWESAYLANISLYETYFLQTGPHCMVSVDDARRYVERVTTPMRFH